MSEQGALSPVEKTSVTKQPPGEDIKRIVLSPAQQQSFNLTILKNN